MMWPRASIGGWRMAESAVAVMSAAALRAVRPRQRLTVSQWADAHRVLTSKQANEVGRWRTARNPMLGEIMDCLSAHSPVREIVIQKSSQVGITESQINWIGYVMDHAPAPVMVLLPTLDARDTWRAQKLNPLITDTPVIRDILGGIRSRDAAQNQDMIDFPGGVLFLSGGNSPSSYAQKSARYLVMDDLDRFPPTVGEEGDPVGLARGRVKAFPRHKILFASTPTIKGASLIEREYQNSDRRRYHIACPHCGEKQILVWSNVKQSLDGASAWYVCAESGCIIEEHEKPRLLASGQWIPENPANPRRGYHISALYAPIGLGPSWLDLVSEFRRVCRDPAQLKPFINGHLGDAWEDQTDKLKPHELAKRASEHAQGVIPPGCLALTIGVDTQDKWLAVTLLGHGADGALFILDHAELNGDTTQRTVWDDLEAYLHAPRVNLHGFTMRPRAAAIDSRGHRTDQVRAFVLRESLRVPVYAVQGATTRMGRAIAAGASHPDKDRRGRRLLGGYGVWNVGTEYCKDYIFGHLAADGDKPPHERTFRFPSDLPDAYYDGLLSETYDPEKKRYVPRLGQRYKRNEPLDCLVYAWAIARHPEVQLGRTRKGREDPSYWGRLAAQLEPQAAAEGEPKNPAPPPAQPTYYIPG